MTSPDPWKAGPQVREFFRALPSLWPAAVLGFVVIEWLLPALLDETRLLAWPFALAIGNAWLLGAIAKVQGLTQQAGLPFGAKRVGDLLTCAAMYWVLTALILFIAVGAMRWGLGRPSTGVEFDPTSDAGFLLAVTLLAYLLLRCTTVCVGVFLDDALTDDGRVPWPRGPVAFVRAWRLSRGWSAHRHGLLPMAVGLLVLIGIQHLRDSQDDGLIEGLLILIWHALAWPAFSWLCLERSHAMAVAALAGLGDRGGAASETARVEVARPSAARDTRDTDDATSRRAPGKRPRPDPGENTMASDMHHYYSPDWSTDDVFLSAAVNGDVATLRRLVDEGVDVDTKDREGVTALLRAANAQQPEAIRFLLAAGADRQARDLGGRSLVHLLAAYPKLLPLLGESITKGASPNEQFEGGVTPLMTALLRGNFEGARMLLARGADPLLRDRHGNTAIIQMLGGIYAFRTGDDHRAALEFLEKLLRLGVDPHAKGDYGRDAMAIAASKGLTDVMALLRRYGPSIEHPDADGLTPLQKAWWSGRREQIEWLLDQDVAVDFFSAVALGRTDEVADMLERDPDLLQRPLKAIRSAPLSIALHCGQAAMVKFLLEQGADPNGPDGASGSLMNAVRHLPDPAVLKLLIAHGASLESGDGDSNTALNYAARDDKLDLALVLLEAGASPNAQTERGYTVLQFAKSEAMRALLQKYGGR